jgi:thiamine-phosphate pyrophosphorylase
MLIIISNPSPIPNEASVINALFDEGMEIFHLRKPGIGIDELRTLLEEIEPAYYDKIALHQQHILGKDFELKRLHFTEMKRKEMEEDDLLKLRESGYILSTSIHDVKDYKKLKACFSYTFFGPVFNSISKQGYTSTITNGFVFPVSEGGPNVIALGGIDTGNIDEAIKMNFNGVAALGTIWQKPEDGVQRFKALQKAWKQIDQ